MSNLDIHMMRRITWVMQLIITSCARGRHNMPHLLQVDLWPFDLESGIWVTSLTCDMGYLCADFSLPRPLCSWLRPDVRDRQMSDVRRASSLNASLPWEWGHNNNSQIYIYIINACWSESAKSLIFLQYYACVTACGSQENSFFYKKKQPLVTILFWMPYYNDLQKLASTYSLSSLSVSNTYIKMAIWYYFTLSFTL